MLAFKQFKNVGKNHRVFKGYFRSGASYDQGHFFMLLEHVCVQMTKWHQICSAMSVSFCEPKIQMKESGHLLHWEKVGKASEPGCSYCSPLAGRYMGARTSRDQPSRFNVVLAKTSGSSANQGRSEPLFAESQFPLHLFHINPGQMILLAGNNASSWHPKTFLPHLLKY